jgi:hypothetical protein
MKILLSPQTFYTEFAAVAAMILTASSFSQAQGLLTQKTLSEQAAVSIAQGAVERRSAVSS